MADLTALSDLRHNRGLIADPESFARDANAAVALRAFLGPDSQVDRIEGVGHFLLVERSQEVNDRILRFLRS